MPVTLPNTFTTTLDATKFNDNFWDPANVNTSFADLNGLLTDANMDGTDWTEVAPEQTQFGTFVQGGAAARTVNLDYFGIEWFKDVDTTAAESTYLDKFQPIPGGCSTFFVPAQGQVVLRWQVSWTNDSTDEDHASQINLFVDGARIESEQRVVKRTCDDTTSHEGRVKARFWSGHYTFESGGGWHNVGLYLAADQDIEQTRIWTTGIRWFWLKD